MYSWIAIAKGHSTIARVYRRTIRVTMQCALRVQMHEMLLCAHDGKPNEGDEQPKGGQNGRWEKCKCRENVWGMGWVDTYATGSRRSNENGKQTESEHAMVAIDSTWGGVK